jgi:hypothetical protein
LEFRSADGNADRLPDLAAELVQMPVDGGDLYAVRLGREADDNNNSDRRCGCC